MNLRRLRTAVTLIAVCLAGSATAVAVASGGGRHGDDDPSTGTTGETTTGTTGETTTTGTTTTGTTNTTTTPGSSQARSPRIVEIEVDSLSRNRLRLRAEIVRRGSRVTKVRFTYRGRKYSAVRRSGEDWSRVVAARGGDRRGDVIRFRVTACAGSRCTTRSGSDEAGG